MSQKKILVIGGCGYIGSHAVNCLLESGYEVMVLDNSSTGYQDSLIGGGLVSGDCGDALLLERLFTEYQFSGVMYFASSIQVGESVIDPAKFYHGKAATALTLLTKMKEHDVGPLIFSSTAAVFGGLDSIPINENHPKKLINAHRMSKCLVEAMLADFDRAYGLRSVVLHYLSAAGADQEARIGEEYIPEASLIPLALQAAIGGGTHKVFSLNYLSLDGTSMLDYLHANDLASAHMLALEYLWRGGDSTSFNLGNGFGFSVQEIINAVTNVTGLQVQIENLLTRPGDQVTRVADVTRAKSILGWQPQHSDLNEIVRDAFNWEQQRHKDSAIKSKNQDPLISVVLPVYNGKKYLHEAIDSVLAQTFLNFELIVIDDGSSDGSLDILRQYELKDSRIRIITRENRGLPATLNELISLSKAGLIARMDADDICLPNRLSEQYEFMKNNPCVVALGSSTYFTDDDGNRVCIFNPPICDDRLRKNFPESPFVHPSVMFRREVFYKAGQYNENMKWGGEDVILFNRMSRFGKLHNLSEPLISYRLVPGSLSRKPPKFRSLLTEIIIDEISGKSVEDSKFNALQEIAKRIDKSDEIFDYYFELAKLNAWSGGSSRKSFIYLENCRILKPFSIKLYFLYTGAILGNTLIKWIYRIFKKKIYATV